MACLTLLNVKTPRGGPTRTNTKVQYHFGYCVHVNDIVAFDTFLLVFLLSGYLICVQKNVWQTKKHISDCTIMLVYTAWAQMGTKYSRNGTSNFSKSASKAPFPHIVFCVINDAGTPTAPRMMEASDSRPRLDLINRAIRFAHFRQLICGASNVMLLIQS